MGLDMGELLPLAFHVKPGNWKKFENRKKSLNYQRIKDLVLADHSNKCAYCGYHSSSLELVNKNHDYQDRSRENIVPGCSLCIPLLFVDGYGQDPNFQGTIIYLPELSQIQLNHLLRASVAILYKHSMYQTKLNELFTTLDERKDYMEKILGKNSHKVEIFAQGLLDIFLNPKKMTHPIFKFLRYVPEKNILKNNAEEYSNVYFIES